MRYSVGRSTAVLVLGALLGSCGGGDGGGSTGPTPNPVPTLTSLSRDTATAGVAAFTLTLHGHAFVGGVTARVDSADRVTSRLNDSTLTMAFLAADLASVVDRHITVDNPAPGGGTSGTILFHVLTPPAAPTLDSITPVHAVPGSGAITLHAYGTEFVGSSRIRWNGADLTTAHPSASHLTATISAGLLASTDTAQVIVFTPTPGGGTSASRPFVIAPIPTPVIVGTTPDTITLGLGPLPFTIRGTGFAGVDSVTLIYQGERRRYPAETVTDTTVSLSLDRSWLGSLGVASFTVRKPLASSNSFLVEIVQPIPVITSLGSDTLDGSAAADTFMVTGTGFYPSMVVRLAGDQVASTTVLSYDSIRAIVDAGSLLHSGTPPVTVYDAWEGRSSAPMPIPVRSPAPTLDSIAFPAKDTVAPEGIHTLFGSNFRAGGEVLVGGTARAATFVSTTKVTFPMLPGDAGTAGIAMIAYRTPAPGGGTTTALSMTIETPNPVPVIDSVTPRAVRSDSGTQFVTFYGPHFVAGTFATLSNDQGVLDSLSIVGGDTTTADVQIPASRLETGAQFYLRLQAPPPTAGPSNPVMIPVWTTGVRNVVDVAGSATYSWASDTLRNLMYGVTVENTTTTLVARDPVTGVATNNLALPDGGAHLFYDGASPYLYATCAFGLKVCRINLNTWRLDWAIEPFTINGSSTAPVFVVPQDGHPGTFALATSMVSNVYGNWIRVYDDTIPRAPMDTFFSGVHAGRFFGDTLVLMNGYYGYRRSVSPGSQSPLDSVALALNAAGPGRILSPTRAVTDGHLFDLTTGADLASSPSMVAAFFAQGPNGPRFYTARPNQTTPGFEFAAFDGMTGALVRKVGLDGGVLSLGISSTGVPFVGLVGTGARLIESVVTDP